MDKWINLLAIPLAAFGLWAAFLPDHFERNTRTIMGGINHAINVTSAAVLILLVFVVGLGPLVLALIL